MLKTPGVRTTFGGSDVEKVHAVVAGSTFRSQNVQNTPFSDHFWKLRCRKSARRCGAKHISKSKCAKRTMVGALLEVEMSKKCTPEAHLEVKMLKTLGVRTTFGSSDLEKVHAIVARSTFGSQNVKNTRVSDTFGGSDVEKVHALVARSTFRSQNVKNSRGLDTFGGSDVVSRGRRTRLWILSKVIKTWGFCSISTKDGRHGTCEDDLQRRIFRGRRSTKDMFMREVGRSGCWFPERGYILELHYTKLHYTTLHYTTLHYTTLHYTEWHCTTDRQADR